MLYILGETQYSPRFADVYGAEEAAEDMNNEDVNNEDDYYWDTINS